jgi:hypothetical protein
VSELALATESVLRDKKMSDTLAVRGAENARRFKWKDTTRQVLKILKAQAEKNT